MPLQKIPGFNAIKDQRQRCSLKRLNLLSVQQIETINIYPQITTPNAKPAPILDADTAQPKTPKSRGVVNSLKAISDYFRFSLRQSDVDLGNYIHNQLQ